MATMRAFRRAPGCRMRFLAILFAGLSIAVLTCVLALKLFQKQFDKRLEREWTALEVAGSGEYHSKDLEGLPPVVARYLARSITEGTKLYSSADYDLGGQITVGVGVAFQPYSAKLRLTPPTGFIRKVEFAQENVSGCETLVNGEGMTRFTRGGYLPGVEKGLDITQIHRAELALLHVLLPTCLLPQRGATWTAVDDTHAVATITIDSEVHELRVVIAADGKLEKASVATRVRLNPGESRRNADLTLVPLAERSTGGLIVPGEYSLTFVTERDGEVPFAHPKVLDVRFR